MLVSLPKGLQRTEAAAPDATALEDELLLPPAIAATSVAVAQRRPSAESRLEGVVQREEAVPGVAEQAAPEVKGKEPDLDKLARQIYPFVKRMLAVERERTSARY
jgi:hypothetical protein